MPVLVVQYFHGDFASLPLTRFAFVCLISRWFCSLLINTISLCICKLMTHTILNWDSREYFYFCIILQINCKELNETIFCMIIKFHIIVIDTKQCCMNVKKQGAKNFDDMVHTSTTNNKFHQANWYINSFIIILLMCDHHRWIGMGFTLIVWLCFCASQLLVIKSILHPFD